MKIIPVDCNYVQKDFATSYLVVSNERGFFIECNTNYAIPRLVQAANQAGLTLEQVEGLIITHVHLDHAGGAGLFLKTFPQAKLYAHPKAARHAIDPSRLIASATQVYGQKFMDELYGQILPCPKERVVILNDGETVSWTGGEFEFKHTRGHANHHGCVIEPKTQTIFTGDSFGVSYPQVNQKKGSVVVIPSTSPTDFDGPAARETVDWVLKKNPKQVALTHFGFLENAKLQSAHEQLTAHLRFSESLVTKIQQEKLSEATVIEHIHDWTIHYYAQKNIHLDKNDLEFLRVDLKVNAQGLIFAAAKI